MTRAGLGTSGMTKPAKRRRLPHYKRGRPDALDFTDASTEDAWDEVDRRDPLTENDVCSRDDWAWSRGVCMLHSIQDLPIAVQNVLDQREWLYYPRHGDRDHVYDVQNDLAAELRSSSEPVKPRKPRMSLNSAAKATLPFRRQSGETLRSIADELGVSPTTIYRALKRPAYA